MIETRTTPREQARMLNEMIDRGLLAPMPGDSAAVVELLKRQEASKAANRVRLRAMRMAKRDASRRAAILAASDALVRALYRRPGRRRWLCGWCNASVVRADSKRRAGIGGIIVDDAGEIVARVCARIGEREPFEAEIAALQAALSAAAAHNGRAWCISLYSDCDALVSLWQTSRGDARLQAVRVMARRFRRFELRSLPRRHNQTAHRLARDAALGRAGQS